MKRKILIVDDAQETALKIASLLSSRLGADAEIRTAFAGDSAVTVACEFKPDLVLLDVQLPVLDGFQVLEELKSRKVATRVIIFSGVHKDTASIVRAIRAGACEFLSKPVDVDVVANSIRKAILVETTLNLQAADTTRLVKQLLDQVEELTKGQHQREIIVQNASKSERRESGFWKLAYIAASTLVVWNLYYMGIVNAGPATLAFIPLFYLLLLLPAERIRNVTASLLGLKAHVEVDVLSGTPKELPRTKDRASAAQKAQEDKRRKGF